jgi:methionyl-tRNA formyltransferase
MLMDEGLDSGPILLQESLSLAPSVTRGELEVDLSVRGAVLLQETLRSLRRSGVRPTPQDHARASWSRLLSRDMRNLDWREPAPKVVRQIHALSPAPGAAARTRGRLVKILRAEALDARCAAGPGQVVELLKRGPVVACETGAVLLLEVQPEGKRPMSGSDFARGGGISPGDVLERLGDG